MVFRIGCSAGLAVIGAIAFILTYGFAEPPFSGQGLYSLGAGGYRPFQADGTLWPRVVSIAIITLCLLNIAAELLRYRVLKKQGLMDQQTCKPPVTYTRRNLIRTAVFTAFIILYYFGIVFIGFPLATLFYGIAVCLLISQKESRVKSVVLTCFLSVAVTVLFTRILYLPLPRGVGIFREITLWLIF